MADPRTIEWIGGIDGFVRIIDQTLLPTELRYIDLKTVEQVWEAIKILRVRGAPAIGVSAAMGVVVGIRSASPNDRNQFEKRLLDICSFLATSRPTAVNLFWALDRMRSHFDKSDAS